jgi:hypothetical protein
MTDVLKNFKGVMLDVSNGDGLKVLTELRIRVLSNGQTQVTGPLNNPKLCMAIFEDAVNVIRAYNPISDLQAGQPIVGAVAPGDVKKF